MNQRIALSDIEAARRAIARIAVETPLLDAPELGAPLGCRARLKLESLQVTGSFKLRGAANKLLSLTPRQRDRGVIACSSGNHGRAVAYVADLLDIPATICIPDWVDPSKLAAIRRHRAETILAGKSYDEAEERSRRLERERGLVYVHPFDDPLVIAGQGTIGLELLESYPLLDTVVVPLSGGGLVGGIAVALKSNVPDLRLVAVSAANARVMHESVHAGEPIAFPEEATLASALSGGIGLENRHTFGLVERLVDDFLLVTEDEIREAMVYAARHLKLVVEGGGAVGIAALLSGRFEGRGENVAVIVSGGNVDPALLSEVLTPRPA